jgi:hypothetical protein
MSKRVAVFLLLAPLLLGARLFDDASSERLDTSSTPVTVPPFTMCAWFNADSLATGSNQIIMGLYQAGNPTHRFLLILMSEVTNDPIQFRVNDQGGPTAAASTGAWSASANTWHSACAVAAASNDWRVYVNGGNEGTDTASVTPADVDQISLGGRVNADYFSGMIGHGCIWSAVLSAADVATWHGGGIGVSCLRVRRADAVFYAPANGTASPEPEIIGGRTMSLFNTPTNAGEEPPIANPILAP